MQGSRGLAVGRLIGVEKDVRFGDGAVAVGRCRIGLRDGSGALFAW